MKKDIMTVTLSAHKPSQSADREFTPGQQATIFQDEDGRFGYRYHGINFRGEYYQSQAITGLESKAAATKAALENYNIGTGC